MGIMNYFKTRKEIEKMAKDIEERIDKLQAKIDIEIWKKLDNLKELEQNKTYYLEVETDEQALFAKEMIWQVKNQIPWTMPLIIITTGKFKEIKARPKISLKKSK